MIALGFGFFEDWELRHKVTIDGDSRTITVNPEVTELDIRNDVYSAVKEWYVMRDNAKFTFPIRTVGGDPTISGQFAGDIYFLINGWRLIINLNQTRVAGILFSDDFDTAYYNDGLGAIYPAVVSSTVNAVETGGGSGMTQTQMDDLADQVSTGVWADPAASQLSSDIAALDSKIDQLDTVGDDVQAMVLAMYRLYGLDPTRPLVVSTTQRTAGDITQSISTDQAGTTTVTRQ